MKKRLSLPNMVSKLRLWYHGTMIDLVNSGNQLGLIKDDAAEELNKKHCMIIFNDIFPRLHPGVDLSKVLGDK